MRNLFSAILDKLKNFDLFELGNSVIVYYLLLFYLTPTILFLGASFKFALSGYEMSYKAMLYLTIGLASLVIGYYSVLPDKIVKKIPNLFGGQWNYEKALWVFGAVLVSGLAIKIIRILKGGYFHIIQDPAFINSSFYSLVMMLNWLGYIALAIAFINYFYLRKIGDEQHRRWRIIAYAVFLLEIAYALPTCSKLSVITPIMLYLIVRWYAFKPDYRTVAVAAIIIFLMFPFGSACRGPAVLNFYAVTENDRINLPNAGVFAADSFLTRINETRVFSRVIESDEISDYGRMIKDFFVTLGPPRFLWKNKPLSLNAMGNELGRKIGVVGSTDLQTHVSPGIVGDFYINFGFWGIILGMFGMGFLWRLVYLYLIKESQKSLSGILIYSLFWIEIVRGIEDWTAPVYAGLIKLSIIMFIIHLFLTKRR